MKIFRHLLISAAVIALGACAAPHDGKPMDVRRELVSRGHNPTALAVLFVGNSYSFGVPKAFAKVAAERGKRATVGQVTHSGWSLARHAANQETLRKIRERHWDVVVLQEQSRLPSMPLRRTWRMAPNVRKLAAEIRKHGGIPVLYQTWGWRDGDPKRPHDDFHAMTSRVREGYREAADKAGGLPVVAVGDVWQHEVSAGRGDGLFLPDGSHPTRRGDLLTAQAFCETFFGKAR